MAGQNSPGSHLFFCCHLVLCIPPSRDNFPPKEMLDQPRTKVINESKCQSPCATFSNMSIVVKGQSITIEAEVHAAKDTGSITGNQDTIYLKRFSWMDEQQIR